MINQDARSRVVCHQKLKREFVSPMRNEYQKLKLSIGRDAVTRPLKDLYVLRPVVSRKGQCDMCRKARAAQCIGPCALRDVAAQMRAAVEIDREHVDHA